MADRMEFKGKLNAVLELATGKDSLSLDEVERFFEEDNLSGEQIELVCDYLMAQNIAVKGYTKSLGRIIRSDKTEVLLNQEEEKYLSIYLKELQEMEKTDRKMYIYLKNVAELAREFCGLEIFLGDIIQEGNVSLMIALKKEREENQEQILLEVRKGMEVFVATQTEAKKKDKKIVERVESIEESIRCLSEELGREVSIDELSAHLNMKEEEIIDILKLEGEDI